MRAFLVLVLVAAVVGGIAAVDARAAPFVVRATAKVQQLGDFNITRDPTLAASVTVLAG